MVSTNEPAVDGEDIKSDEVKKPRKSNGQKKNRKPRVKDWIRVQKSTGNGVVNKEVILRINEATGIVEVLTNAPKSEGSDEAEGQRCQVIKITGFEVINDPNADPLGENEQPASESNEGDSQEASEEQPAS